MNFETQNKNPQKYRRANRRILRSFQLIFSNFNVMLLTKKRKD